MLAGFRAWGNDCGARTPGRGRTTWIGLLTLSALCLALATLSNDDALLQIIPVSAWNVLALVVVLLATTALLVAVVKGDAPAGPPRGIAWRNVALRWLLPPPPAARRAYAQRTRREVK
jgi:hypothetical protein